jgi:hypothetical protein
MINIGRMAEKYGMLPHQVEQSATTYDLMISDVLATYDRYEQAKAKGGTLDPSVYNFSKQELQNIFDKGKKENGK